jgi:probable rRNA maturation factor
MKQTYLEITFADSRWRKIPQLEERLEKAAQKLLEHLLKHSRLPFNAAVMLTGNTVIRRLNRDFRGLDKPTNVLSFPQYDHGKLPKKGRSKSPIFIGDIAIAYQYVVVEAKNEHKILLNHVTHLVIHGLLHLLGYDHLADKEASRMERLETKIMAALGLPDPYLAAKPRELKKVQTGGRKRRTPAKPKR